MDKKSSEFCHSQGISLISTGDGIYPPTTLPHPPQTEKINVQFNIVLGVGGEEMFWSFEMHVLAMRVLDNAIS